MKIINYLIIVLISLFVVGCSKITESDNNGLGSRAISYQSDDQSDSLVIPPSLTNPSLQGDFFNPIETDKSTLILNSKSIEVKRDNFRRWLLVELPINDVWLKAKDFFRSYGFIIEKENKKTGIFETDFLEIETAVPEKSLGVIRAALSKALKTQYGLPIADKYRVRIEPASDDSNFSEVYLTLSSIGEVASGTTRVWQQREKDVELETEMLLKLMVFLGSSLEESVEKIKSNELVSDSPASLIESPGENAILVFKFDREQSWRYLGWVLDELSIDIEDRDSLDRSYYINIPLNKGFFSRLLTSSEDIVTYKLIIRENGKESSQVIISELSGQENQKTIDFSYEFFEKIVNKF